MLCIGIFASRLAKPSSEDYFVASRSLSQYVFLLALFGTNMTAFAILGSSGVAYHRGIGIFGLMASSSALVIPLTLFFIGTRLWAIGKKFGHMTQVQFFRDRWECSAIGTVIFVLTIVMFVPYIIIGVMGGGHTLEAVSTTIGPDGEQRAFFSYEMGGAIVALVIMSYVFLGGMRGTAWVNAFQTLLFLGFGVAAFCMISRNLGGLDEVVAKLGAEAKTAPLLTRQRIPVEEFLSYTFIPLSSIMFPHMAIMCFTAERVTHFKKTVVFYPICMILLWLPCVLLGVVAASQFPGLRPGESDDVLLRLLTANTNVWLAGILGAGIMACVMAADSQILAMSTMFTEDLFAHYGGRERFGPQTGVWTGRAFVVGVTVVAYLIALQVKDKASIFELAIRFAFSGFAGMAPVMIAALFWRRSNKWGALAATLWVAATMFGSWYLYSATQEIAPKPGQPFVQIFPALGDLFQRSATNVLVHGYLPVLPMCLGSALWMIVVSLLTPPPKRATIERYFPK
ncbi:MAG: sodium:solute symporter family protein [Terrimicrobiaceae bacterium]